MKLKTSDFLLEKKEDLKKIIEILSKEFSYVSILGSDVSGSTYTVTTSGISLAPSPDSERGFVVRVFQESGFSEYSFNRVDIEEVCARARKVAKNDRLLYSEKGHLVYKQEPKDKGHKLFKVNETSILPEDIDPKEIINKMVNIHDTVKAKYSKVIQLATRLIVTQVNKIFLSLESDMYQSYIYATGMGYAIASEENNIQKDFITTSGLCGYELLDKIEEICDEAARRSEELLKAERLVAGEYDIICDPDFTGLIAHEAFGHGAEMDMFVKDRAKGQEYMNKRVASDKVVMHDGASALKEVSSYYFDDEGNLAGDTIIIDKGMLVAGMCDELSALQLNVSPTGNGKRESYKRKAYTRMTNTFFDEGEDSLEDMIKSIKFGYLLEGFSSGMEDPKNWGIQCVASKGREIVDGKLTGKVVSPVFLTGYVPDLLESISMVSKGLVMSGSGYCGKGSKEWVKTSTGGSYIKARGKLS